MTKVRMSRRTVKCSCCQKVAMIQPMRPTYPQPEKCFACRKGNCNHE